MINAIPYGTAYSLAFIAISWRTAISLLETERSLCTIKTIAVNSFTPRTIIYCTYFKHSRITHCSYMRHIPSITITVPTWICCFYEIPIITRISCITCTTTACMNRCTQNICWHNADHYHQSNKKGYNRLQPLLYYLSHCKSPP